MNTLDAEAILTLLAQIVRERDQARQALGKARSELRVLQIERDELAVKARRLEQPKGKPKDDAE
jgi:hypothetical protein